MKSCNRIDQSTQLAYINWTYLRLDRQPQHLTKTTRSKRCALSGSGINHNLCVTLVCFVCTLRILCAFAYFVYCVFCVFFAYFVCVSLISCFFVPPINTTSIPQDDERTLQTSELYQAVVPAYPVPASLVGVEHWVRWGNQGFW